MSAPLTNLVLKTIKYSLISIGIILAISLISSVFSAAKGSEYHSNYEKMPAINRMPPLVAKWAQPPNIVVCDTAPVDEIRVRSTIRFWESKGFRFGKLEFKRPTPDAKAICSDTAPLGTIVIHLAPRTNTMEPTTLARTHFYVDNGTKKIRWAVINLRIEPPERVLEHEFGHALGFLHYNKSGHLMHESQPLGGWDTSGLTK
jgi:hypothetical protein